MEKRKQKVVIVGAGMGGLTAAAYLCKEKYDVLLLEKNNKTGGLVNSFYRDGFLFDTGPRAFVNSGIVKPILKDLDIEFETIKNDISIMIEDEKICIHSMDSLNEYKKMLIKLYPKEEDNIKKIFKKISKLSKYTQILYAFDNPNFVDYMSDKKFVITKLFPWLFKLLYALKKFKKFDLSMEEFLNGLTKNQSLIDILTQFFFKNTPTYFAMGYFPVWLDYFYPKNGTGDLPKLVHEKILKNGGGIKLNTKIEKIIPSELKIIDSEGNDYEYDHLIWAADLKSLYKKMDSSGLDKETIKKIDEKEAEIMSSKPSESSFVIYFGVDCPSSYFENKGGAHLFYTPSKKGLGNINKEEKEKILRNFNKKSKKEILNWADSFCNLNTYEVSIPTLRNPLLSPKGKTGIMISFLFDYEVMKKITDAGWGEEFKETIENKIIKLFSKSLYKNIEKDILFKFSTTPLNINKVVDSSGGAIVGWSFETKSPVVNSFKDLPKSANTPIPNLYQAGQWAYNPAGVPMAMITGWNATQEIMKPEIKPSKNI